MFFFEIDFFLLGKGTGSLLKFSTLPNGQRGINGFGRATAGLTIAIGPAMEAQALQASSQSGFKGSMRMICSRKMLSRSTISPV